MQFHPVQLSCYLVFAETFSKNIQYFHEGMHIFKMGCLFYVISRFETLQTTLSEM